MTPDDWRREFPKAEAEPETETAREERELFEPVMRAFMLKVLTWAAIALAAVVGWHLRGMV